MATELTLEDIAVILESLEYSKVHIREAPGTPYSVRQAKLEEMEGVRAKLAEARRRLKTT